MAETITVENFRSELLNFYKETFEQVMGIYLDKGTSLFETLATISAEEASRPVSATCASLAAQVDHVRFYLDVLMQYINGTPPAEKVNWGEIWQTVHEVTPEQWDAIKKRLEASYQRVKHLAEVHPQMESVVGDFMATIVHTAYHLGEIRQALCVIKSV